jgi:hypothetical protein
MFELKKAVESWSRAVIASSCRDAERMAEMADHLYCEIERARIQGMSDEQAFAAAVARVGSAGTLANEHAKNRSVLAVSCATLASFERGAGGSEHRGFLLVHAFLWASLMVATALVLHKASTPAALSFLLVVVLIPLHWASEQLLRRALQHRRSGGPR